MDRIFMPDAEQEERLQMLKENCDMEIEDTYFHKLTSDEIIVKEKHITQTVIELSEIEDEKSETMKDFKKRIDPLKDEIKRQTTCVKTGHEERFGRLYQFLNVKKKMVYFYDCNGMLIETKTRPAEVQDLHRQLRITGTDN